MSQPPSLQSPLHTPPPSTPTTIPIPASFTARKARILAQLAVPDDEYTDLSPKGTVDAGIRALIGELNGADTGFVTTSSCAGRVSVFLEGRRGGGVGGELPGHYVADLGGEEEQRGGGAGFGGKGGGGRWLFVSHEPVQTDGKLDSEPNIVAALLGMEEPIFKAVDGGGVGGGAGKGELGGGGVRLIHFKFEPMVCCLWMI